MLPPIDISNPDNWKGENMPLLVGGLLAKMEQNTEDHQEIKEILTEHKKILQEHEECLEIFRFSKCKVVPWLGRNKWVVAAAFTGLSIWISSLDWLNRWAQGAFFPPRPGP